MAVIVVTNAANSGAGSLRAAIDLANGTVEADRIVFDAALAGATIRLFDFDPATDLPETGGLRNGALFVSSSSLTIDGDIDGDGEGDITISGDADADGFASAADVQIFAVNGDVPAFALNGLSLVGGYGRSAPDAPGAPVVARDGGIAVSAIDSRAGETRVSDLVIGPGEARAENGAIDGDGGAAATVVVTGTSVFSNVLFTDVRAYAGQGAGGGRGGAAVAGILNTGDLTLHEVGFTGSYALAGARPEAGRAAVGVLNTGAVGGIGGAGPTILFGEAGGYFGNAAIAEGGGVIGVYDYAGGVTTVPLQRGFAGGLLDDRLTVASLGENRIVAGFAGDDVIRGSGAAETLLGGAGADLLLGARGEDEIEGGAGADTIRAGGGGDRVSGGAGDDRLLGGGGDDSVGGNAGDDFIGGGAGDDTLLGMRGDDVLRGGAGADRLEGAAGDDTLIGGAGDDTLLGMRGDDMLRGGAGADRLVGAAGDDTLDGGAGDDVLIGRGGADLFVFGANHGADVIRGFQQGADRLDFSFLEGIGDLTFTQQGSSTIIAHAAGSVRLVGQFVEDFDEADFLF